MRRRLFWPLVLLASAMAALAAASLAIAAFSDPLPRQTFEYTPYAPVGSSEVFDRAVSLDWSADRGLLIAAIVFAAASLGTSALALGCAETAAGRALPAPHTGAQGEGRVGLLLGFMLVESRQTFDEFSRRGS